jgi:CelD/BcsL family acetyltransferase involved in cellulose biosynthesis
MAVRQVRVVTGREGTTAALHAARGLLEDAGAPFCARPFWLSAWLATAPVEPMAVVVEDVDGPAGLGCLALSRRGPVRTVMLAGAGPSDYALLPARDEAAVAALAGGIVELAGRLPGRWRLRFDQLPPGDPVAARLCAELPGARLAPGQGCPRLTFGPDRALERHMSKNGRKMARRGRRRMVQRHADVRLDRVVDPAEIGRLAPDLIALHRDRDHALGRRSDLDDPARHAFHVSALARLAAAGQAEAWLLWLDGALGGYLIGVRDGRVYRLWDGRISSAWPELKVGRVLDSAVLAAALAEPELCELDWMRGEQEHKLQAATHVVGTEQVLAESSRAVAAAEQLASTLRRRVRYSAPNRLAVRLRHPRPSRLAPIGAGGSGGRPGPLAVGADRAETSGRGWRRDPPFSASWTGVNHRSG